VAIYVPQKHVGAHFTSLTGPAVEPQALLKEN
jgi:hypothetical protein